MSAKSTGLKITGLILLIIALVSGAKLWQTLDTSASDVADNTTPLKSVVFKDEALIKKGEYVMRAGDCVACHTESSGDFAGGYEIATAFGSLVSSNITPDAETGIGNMTERDFFNAVRQGVGSHGLLYPAMPFTAYRKMTDEDMHALWAYMSTLEPVSNSIDENAGMNFPFNIRLAMSGWDLLFFENDGFKTDASQSATHNRGRYLAQGPAHCGTCHSPRNILGAEQDDQYLQGYNMVDWYAPDITPNPGSLVAGDSDGLKQYLKTGTNGVAVASGPMAEAVEHSLQYLNDSDISALTTFLQSLPPSGNASSADNSEIINPLASTEGELSYEVNCAACHGVEGEGIKGMIPAFAQNAGIQTDDATNLVHAMLMGTRAPHTDAKPTAAGMPSFAWKMDDQEVAIVLNYIRNSWGNSAAPVTVAKVSSMRKQLDARDKLNSPY